ncbi:MAG: hypothetical protein ACE5NP_02500 [Anaerolineae bacterium]
MAKAHIKAGSCGFTVDVVATLQDKRTVNLEIASDCPNLEPLIQELKQVDPYYEVEPRSDKARIRPLVNEHLQHCASCPAPIGILKAVEVAAGFAVPKDVHIELSRE